MSAGSTLPTALAAPVPEGMMLKQAPRPPRQSLTDGPSTTCTGSARPGSLLRPGSGSGARVRMRVRVRAGVRAGATALVRAGGC